MESPVLESPPSTAIRAARLVCLITVCATAWVALFSPRLLVMDIYYSNVPKQDHFESYEMVLQRLQVSLPASTKVALYLAHSPLQQWCIWAAIAALLVCLERRSNSDLMLLAAYSAIGFCAASFAAFVALAAIAPLATIVTGLPSP